MLSCYVLSMALAPANPSIAVHCEFHWLRRLRLRPPAQQEPGFGLMDYGVPNGNKGKTVIYDGNLSGGNPLLMDPDVNLKARPPALRSGEHPASTPAARSSLCNRFPASALTMPAC